MKVFYILVSLIVLTAGSPQQNAILFPGEESAVIEDNDPEDTYDYENFGEYEDESYEDFGYDGDYVDLPEWMDTDLDELSLDKLAFLNNVTEFTDLSGFFELDLDAFLELPNRTQSELDIDSRSGHTSAPAVEKKDENAKFAKCKPEKVTVELPKATKNTLYMPSCVRLMRCGGCCNSKLLSCQPTKVENITLTVMKISKCSSRRRRSPGGCGSRRRRGRRTSGQKVPMAMQNHVKCKCDCKVQEEHCDDELHNYNKAGCSCECKNGEEEMECQKSSALHKWDKKLCSCMCRKEKECSTGEEFSQKTCKCVTANGGDV